MNKAILLNAIMDLSRTIDGTVYLTKIGYREFTGNQWNENWGWKAGAEDELRRLSISELRDVYDGISSYKPISGKFIGTDEFVFEMMDELHKAMTESVNINNL